ncbi:hypothetical protein RRG08_055095, partial [Elysia crispata]
DTGGSETSELSSSKQRDAGEMRHRTHPPNRGMLGK